MEKISLEIIGITSSQSQIGSYALILAEKRGKRRLPIIIGSFEAQSIAFELENYPRPRPLTHDLMVSILLQYNVELKEVIINNLKEGVFYSKLVLSQNGNIIEIDARPSDAIALGVRYKAPIYTYESILLESGLIIKDDEDSNLEDDLEEEIENLSIEVALESNDEKIARLNVKIDEAINNEDYELAAKLRDEIRKIELGL